MERVLTILGSGTVAALLLAGLAFCCRSLIAHWLNRDIERIRAQFQKEVNDAKAKNDQQLEAYKVTLIAEAEGAKAKQSVRTAAALRVAELRFQAIDELGRSVQGIAIKTLSFLGVAVADPTLHAEYEREFHQRIHRMSEAIIGSANFMELEDHMRLLQLQSKVVELAKESTGPGYCLEGQAFHDTRAVLTDLQIAATKVVRKYLEAMADVNPPA